MTVCLFVGLQGLSVGMFVNLFVGLFVCLAVCLFIREHINYKVLNSSDYMCMQTQERILVRKWSLTVYVCLSVCLSVCLFIC